MLLNAEAHYNVLVIGSGIAGVMAALEAAKQGKTTALVSNGKIFSGSSFYPGTWGLGLVAPENEMDTEDLVQTILSVGCGMADEEMVRTFAGGISSAVATVKHMGIKLKQAEKSDQKDFIPCFDHKHRAWNGILFDSAVKTFSDEMDRLNIEKLPNYEVLELVNDGGSVIGAVFNSSNKELVYITCDALILATGGYGSLFEKRLTTDDACATGQYLALKVGCSLVNMEFMQMMPGYISPCYKTIFNERTFRYGEFTSHSKDILSGCKNKKELLELHSTHGPFTSRLSSMEVDLAISKSAAEKGVQVTYTDDLQKNMPEFIKTYFDWLWENKHLTVNDTIYIDMFVHAANGGIKINPDASTPVKGLFACGEVTGGMHGADRIGGLSTANGLVFGIKAGQSAASFCEKSKGIKVNPYNLQMWEIEDADKIRASMRRIMSCCGMVIRNGKALTNGIEQIESLIKHCRKKETDNVEKAANSRRLWAQLNMSLCILNAQLLRKESRGSHYREDYPSESREMEKRIIISVSDDKVKVCFEEE